LFINLEEIRGWVTSKDVEAELEDKLRGEVVSKHTFIQITRCIVMLK
jgi:hypothetical protein